MDESQEQNRGALWSDLSQGTAKATKEKSLFMGVIEGELWKSARKWQEPGAVGRIKKTALKKEKRGHSFYPAPLPGYSYNVRKKK